MVQPAFALNAADGLIAYQADRASHQVWVMNPDGSDPHLLMGDVVGPVAWSADGSRIAFERPSPSQPAAVWVASADGSDQRLVVSGGLEPVWTPDGRILFLLPRPLGPSVVVADANGSHRHVLIRAGQFVNLGTPLVLPTGRMIVSGTTAPGQVLHQWTLDRNGHQLAPLNDPVGAGGDPVIVLGMAPHGHRITILDDNGEQTIWEQGTLAGNTVTVDPSWRFYSYSEGGAMWSPGGDAILTEATLASDPNDPYHVTEAQIQLLNPDMPLPQPGTLIGPTNGGSNYQVTWQPRCTTNVTESNAVIQTGPAADRICIHANGVTLHAGRRNDVIWVYGSHDAIWAGKGRDMISVHGTDNTVHAGKGADLINTRDYEPGTNTVYGGNGNDLCITSNHDTTHCEAHR